jgi:hypothetical protein
MSQSKTEKIETAKALAANAGRVADLRAQRESQFAARQARAVTEPEPDALYLARKLRRDMPNNRAVEIVTKECERLAALAAHCTCHGGNASTPKPAPVDSVVNKPPVHNEPVNSVVNSDVNSDEARREYRREWMRKKRAGLSE